MDNVDVSNVTFFHSIRCRNAQKKWAESWGGHQSITGQANSKKGRISLKSTINIKD